MEILLALVILIGAFSLMNGAKDQAIAAAQVAPPGDMGCLLGGALWIALPGIVAVLIVMMIAGQI